MDRIRRQQGGIALSLRQNWIKCGLAVISLAAPAFGQIVVYHTVTTVEIGTSRQFTSYVPLSPNTVVWSVNGVDGGNAIFGTVTNTGMFQAPVTAPTPSVVKIRATSTAYPDKFGEATVTLTRPTPWIWSITPKTIAPGSFEIRLKGANYKPDAQVRMNGAPLTTTYVSTTGLRATGSAAAPGTVSITVYLPGPGEVTSEAFNLNVVSPSMTITPPSATLTTGASRTFAASMPAAWLV